jgi:hypothetical protein
MAINFPSSPANNDLHTVGPTTWRWDNVSRSWVGTDNIVSTVCMN